MNTKPIIVFSILILLSGTTLANESMNRNSKFDSYLRECNDSYFSPYAKTIPCLLIIEKESLANFTNPESSIYDPSVVKVYGNIPKIETKSQLLEHVSMLRRIRDDSTNEMIPILYPKGPVVQYGANTIQRGYIVIELYDDDEQETSYSESEFDKIYNILRKNAIKVGIDDYPVIFVLTNNTQLIGSLDIHAWYESDEHVFSLESVYTAEHLIQDLSYIADQNVSVKVNAVKNLVEIGEPAVLPLIQALEGDDPQVRARAAEALGGIKDERAIEPLTKALDDEYELVRTRAKSGLEGIENKGKYEVIATYGKEREFYIEEEKQNFLDKLDNIVSEVRGDMEKYIQPNGPVSSYGYNYNYNYNGYISVEFLEGSRVTESLMNEIYGIFDRQGRQMGIDEVPVVFKNAVPEVPDILYEEIPAPPKTQGFTAITLLVAFLGVFIRKQK